MIQWFHRRSWPIRSAWRKYGWRAVPYLAALNFSSSPRPVRVQPPNVRHPFYLRTRTTDRHVFNQLFMEREYDVAFTKKPRVIMDCGANIGLASIVFANKFHRSRIIAVEPDPENFRIAEKNLAPYPGATVVRGAAWKRNGELTVYDPGGEHGEWGLRVAESPPSGARVVGRVPAMTLDRIMADFELSYIDFLKIDIEGAEAEVFQDASAWIDRVGVLLIECHERFRPGCESIVQRAAAGFEVQYREANHLLFARPGRIRRLRGKKFR